MKTSIKIAILIAIFFSSFTNCFSDNISKKQVDKKLAKYLTIGDFGAAYTLLYKFTTQEYIKKHYETALYYNTMNISLIETHADYFTNNGMTIDLYFSNLSFNIDILLGMKDIETAIQWYLGIDDAIKQHKPDLLPDISKSICYQLATCKNQQYADSIYCLQDVLDIISKRSVNQENVDLYIRLCNCFYINRLYNSHNKNTMCNNKFFEIVDWYEKNKGYIQNLNSKEYLNEIIRFKIQYTENLRLLASNIGIQRRDLENSNKLFMEAIEILTPIEKFDSTISLSIASCYANIARNHYISRDYANCKLYSDKTISFIYNHPNNMDYIGIASNLQFLYYSLNQYHTAAEISKEIINTRNKTEYKPTFNDWYTYLMELQMFDPIKALQLSDSLAKYITNEEDEFNYHINISYSFDILSKYNTNYLDSFIFHTQKATQIFNINLNNYDNPYLKSNKILLNSLSGEILLRQGKINEALPYYIENIQLIDNQKSENLFFTTAISQKTNNIELIHKYLPIYFAKLNEELNILSNALSSSETDSVLNQGFAPLFNISEWVSWNPNDTISLSIGYDAALLIKKLTLRFNNIIPLIVQDSSTANDKIKLDYLRDNIYCTNNDKDRESIIFDYRIAERELLSKFEQKDIHWQDVKNSLNDNECCIEFVKYITNTHPWEKDEPKVHYAAFILSKAKKYPVFVDLLDEDILNEIYKLQPKSYNSITGHFLYNQLWKKIGSNIEGFQTTYFAPTGIMNLIGVEFLTDSTNITAIEKFNLKRILSTGELIQSFKENKLNHIIAFGGIDYKIENDSRSLLDSIITRGHWNYLDNSAVEISNISKTISSNGVSVECYSGDKATESQFKNLDNTDANIIHIASHGFYIRPEQRNSVNYFSKSKYTKHIQDKLFYSGLILSGGQESWNDSVYGINNNDGILTSYEISKMDLHNVNLVVLSACETGLGDNNYDGIYGLQLAFKKAGVKSILMSLWKVDDKVTAEYMSTFYELIAKGASIHEAYKKTVQQIKSKYPDPFYWAAFILLD